ncbi:MAG TPA: AAA family ATPase [Gammaproteobacteria bacterium]|nr:AAA family ATPase [Gammaproteobacteria bacterium]
MYLEHFGLNEPPFSITPDTGYFFAGSDHQAALNMLLVALRSGEGFLKLVGEVGLGKTLLCRKLLAALEDGFVTAYIPNPEITPKAMHVLLAEELGFRVSASSTQERLYKAITQRLVDNAREGRRTVLLLDEAQALNDQTLESVRLLSNLETEKYKLLQVVLVGQPELERRLNRRNIRQLRQRITFSHRLRPFDRDTFEAYVAHRLSVAGYRGPALFSAAALRIIYHASGGVPRLINILCHKALLAAYGPGAFRVTRGHARDAVADTEGANGHRAGRILGGLRSHGYALVAALAVSLGLAWLLGGLF